MPRCPGAGKRLAAGLALALAAPTAAQVALPPPSGQPQRVAPADDALVAFLARADSGGAFRSIVGKAVAAHPAVAEAIAVQQETVAVRTEVRAGLFPTLEAQLYGYRALTRDFGDRDAIVESLQPRGRADAVVTGEQLLYDFGALGNRIAAATERTRAAEAEVRRIAGETALRAVRSWYEVLAFQTLVELSAANVARHRSIVADARARAEQGVGAGGDVSRGEAYLADAEALAVRYERELANARANYREAFGVDPAPRLFRAAPIASTAQSYDAAQALSRAAYPGVQVAQAQLASAKREARAARRDRLPRLSAGISGNRYEIFDGQDYEVRANIVLRQNLSVGGALRARADQAAARTRQAEAFADRAIDEAERDAGIAFRDVELLGRQRGTLENAYIANRRSRDAYVEQFRVARGSLIELVRTEQEYFAAAANYIQGALELDVARYTLLVRTGEALPAFGVTLTAREI